MSSKRKRASLFAGGSLIAASLLAVGGASFGPTTALAAEECGSPPSGTKICSGTHAAIDYPVTTGNLTLNLANDLNVTTGGIAVDGTGSNSVTIGRSNTGAATLDPTVTSTSDAGIAVNNATGAITVNLTDPAFATGPGIAVTGTTHGLQLETAATGGISVTQTNGSIAATGANGVGIQTETLSTGSGNTTLNIGGLVTGATGIDATTNGTGTLTLNVNAASASVAGGEVVGTAGPALQLSPNANANITLNAGTTVRSGSTAGPVIAISGINATRTVFVAVNGGTIRDNASEDDALIVQVDGGAGNITLQANTTSSVQGRLIGRLDLNNTGNANINLNTTSIWRTSGTSFLGDGITTLSQAAGAVLITNTDGADTELDFGEEADFYNQAGLLAVGGGTEAATTLTFTSLGAWNSSGTVLFGANGTNTATDGVANDRIVAEGTVFNGSGAARLVMDVDLAGVQSDCATQTAADCLVLTNGRVNGVTSILINDISTEAGFQSGGILLVDVSGTGGSSADVFVLDAANADYADDANLGGIIDRGLYFYGLSYDEDAQQHFILGMPKRETVQVATLGHMAQTTWRLGSQTWFERQADLRDTLRDRSPGLAPGAWVRMVAGRADRTIDNTGARFTYRALSGYDQESVGLTGGVDVISLAGDRGAYVAGVTAGYVTSDTVFKDSPTQAKMEGHSLGAYASYAAGPLFVDGVISGSWLDAEYDAPALGLSDASRATGKLNSVGVQLEGGFRLPINEGDAHFEPLLALSYVTTDIRDFALMDGALTSDDLTSFRGSVGARLSGDLAVQDFTLRMGLLGRVWEEFEGENTSLVTAGDVVIPLLDDVSGTFNEVALDLALYSNGPWRHISLLLNTGIQFADDYKNSTGSLGFRYQW